MVVGRQERQEQSHLTTIWRLLSCVAKKNMVNPLITSGSLRKIGEYLCSDACNLMRKGRSVWARSALVVLHMAPHQDYPL